MLKEDSTPPQLEANEQLIALLDQAGRKRGVSIQPEFYALLRSEVRWRRSADFPEGVAPAVHEQLAKLAEDVVHEHMAAATDSGLRDLTDEAADFDGLYVPQLFERALAAGDADRRRSRRK